MWAQVPGGSSHTEPEEALEDGVYTRTHKGWLMDTP